MTPERFARLKALFAEASELPEGKRRAHLEAITKDAAIIEEALTLVREHEAAGSRATNIAEPAIALMAEPQAPELKAGDSLGAWKLVEEIGHGGMGAVFRAERADGHFRQASAIKILQGMASREKLEYLARERQILASLSHPNIARLLDGGATPGGRPYLVMEHVEGMPLDHYCRARHLDLRQRLSLFLGVCDAISFAHQRLVIHCDIKPANVMVDRRGRAVLLDFGISRLVRSGEESEGAAAFTPGYASPEQRAGEALGTATDIYGLGKLLEATVDATAQPKRDWELERVVAKATAPAPADRYPSAFLLAEDIRRYLEHQPLRAVPSTASYRLRKYAQRRPVEAIVAAVVILVFLAFVQRIAEERNAAVLARKAAEAQRDRALQNPPSPDSSALEPRLPR